MDQRVTCCITGGGPAGMMLGILLARAGVDVLVLEKHKDFLRDFRGDTIHPSTLRLMEELGWLADFLKLPHQEVKRLSGQFGDTRIELANFSNLPISTKFIALMPQWDFLDFLAEKGRAYPKFALRMNAEATDLIYDGGRVSGVKVITPEGPLTVVANLVVAADGRSSTLRKSAGLVSESFGAPMDVMWFRLPRLPTDTEETQARIDAGHIFIMLQRGDYWQCAYVIPKSGDAKVRAAGLDAFRKSVGALLPFDAARADAISDWDHVKLLTVVVDRLNEWARPGLLCIGDAAHAMSPVGGVGINLAVQDAVATANLLWQPLKEKRLSFNDLKKVQARRDFPTRATQRLQLTVQNLVIAKTLAKTSELKPPLVLRLFNSLPFLSRIPARLIGLGFRPEHVSDAIRAGTGA
ncbi:MAG TPA: FAD-dependent oxidoreductase [Hyphomicrobium sp.]|jgi:2-polyprenyl-6-methoxyphenol hydroxylase-like FAD-dependent oxidoreductase|nr:FAD-dependent oxidoreductase [Hyphomicrobium sp.]